MATIFLLQKSYILYIRVLWTLTVLACPGALGPDLNEELPLPAALS